VLTAVTCVATRRVDPDLGRAELAAAVDERDLVAEAREEERFLDRGVAAADDEDVLVPEESAVARRTRRDAAALQPLLGLESEPAGARTRGHDDGPGAVLLVLDPHPERPLREVDARHVVGHEIRA